MGSRSAFVSCAACLIVLLIGAACVVSHPLPPRQEQPGRRVSPAPPLERRETGLLGRPSGDCPEKASLRYVEAVRDKAVAAWSSIRSRPVNGRVVVAFRLTASGELIEMQVRESDDPQLSEEVRAAMRAAAPFSVMPPEIRCLAEATLVATFTLFSMP
jgi:TonB family protein